MRFFRRLKPNKVEKAYAKLCREYIDRHFTTEHWRPFDATELLNRIEQCHRTQQRFWDDVARVRNGLKPRTLEELQAPPSNVEEWTERAPVKPAIEVPANE